MARPTAPDALPSSSRPCRRLPTRTRKSAAVDVVGSEPPALGGLVAVLAEDAVFLLASGPHDREMFDALIARRSGAYTAAARGAPHARMLTGFDAWVIDMVRAMAPLSHPGGCQ